MSKSSPLTERRQVLIVDDDEGLRTALVESLRDAGVAASQARDGVDALEKIRVGWPPCLLVLDMNMPRLDGRGLVAELRADRVLSTIPVITMTAGAAPLELEGYGHLTKPFDLASLLSLLFEACRHCGICDGEGPVIGSIFAARRKAELAR